MVIAPRRGSAFDLIKWCEFNLTTKIHLCLTPAHYRGYEYE